MTSSVRVPFTAPYPGAEVLAFHRRRAIDGVTMVDDDRLRTVVPISGSAATIDVALAPDDAGLEVALSGTAIDAATADRLHTRVRRAFDTDLDPAVVLATLADDPIVGPSVRAAPGRRLPGTLDPWATLVLAVAAQGVTVAAARAVATRVADAAGRGDGFPSPIAGGPSRTFPTPDRVAALGADRLAATGLGARRGATVHALATWLADDASPPDLDDPAHADDILAALRGIPGIGPWTLGYVAMRVLHQTDAFPPGDAAVRAAFRRRGVPADDRTIAAAAERWRPWRAYACLHLWSGEGA
jgi:AraC family transcriptional regulator of adaptative response / DNA-3-methyladenine glycosylase II